MNLAALGLSPATVADCAALAEGTLRPARCLSATARFAFVATEDAELLAHLPPSVLTDPRTRPVAGDYLAVDVQHVVVRAVLPRKTEIVRQAAGKKVVAQVLVANVDVVFVLTSMDADLSVRRVERYLSLIRPTGARPVVLLTKAGLAKDVEGKLAMIREVAPDVTVLAIDVVSGIQAEVVWDHFAEGETAALLGSSGVGKSTLANHLLGEAKHAVGAVRERDAKGRHTTTSRELVFLRGNRALVDTPGLREIHLWDEDTGVIETFPEIEALSETCRFRDCHHAGEPGCAVTAAVGRGEVTAERVASFRALAAEAGAQHERIVVAERKAAGRVGARALREATKQKGK